MSRHISLLFLFITTLSFGQDQLDKIDVQTYNLFIHVNDDDDKIFVREIVTIKFLVDVDRFFLDLASEKETLCFFWLEEAFLRSQIKSIICILYVHKRLLSI